MFMTRIPVGRTRIPFGGFASLGRLLPDRRSDDWLCWLGWCFYAQGYFSRR